MFNDLLMQLTGLAGFAALVALLINILKSVGIVKDDKAEIWSAGGNLLGLIALYLLRLFNPEFNVPNADAQISTFVSAVTPLVGYILMLLSSKLSHIAVRGVPVIGKSYSK